MVRRLGDWSHFSQPSPQMAVKKVVMAIDPRKRGSDCVHVQSHGSKRRADERVHDHVIPSGELDVF